MEPSLTLSALRRIQQQILPQSADASAGPLPGSERSRRALLTGSASILARLFQVGVSLVVMPLALRYLGNERFGLWMTIGSVLSMVAFADLGVGNGVLNAVARAFGQDDLDGVRSVVSSGFAILTSIAAAIALVFFLLYPFVNWADLFRVVSPQARAEAGPSLAVFVLCFALNVSLDVVQRVQLGLQQGYRYAAWQPCGSLLGLVAILAAIHLHAGMPVLIAALAGAPTLTTFVNALHFFGVARPDLRPGVRRVSRQTMRRIVNLGGLFFILQFAVAVSSSSDNVILTRILGPLAVAQYAVPSRLFALVAMLASFLVTPLWPAYGEALERGDSLWIRATLRRSLLLVATLSISLSAVLILAGPSIIRIWVGTAVSAPRPLLIALAVSNVLTALGFTLTIFLSGLSVVRFQAVTALLAAAANIYLSIYLTRRVGIPGVVYGTILSQLFVCLIPYSWYIARYLRLPHPVPPPPAVQLP